MEIYKTKLISHDFECKVHLNTWSNWITMFKKELPLFTNLIQYLADNQYVYISSGFSAYLSKPKGII
jgi:hypothetical protein